MMTPGSRPPRDSVETEGDGMIVTDEPTTIRQEDKMTSEEYEMMMEELSKLPAEDLKVRRRFFDEMAQLDTEGPMKLSNVDELITLRNYRRKWKKLAAAAMNEFLEVKLNGVPVDSMITFMPVREAIRDECLRCLSESSARLAGLGVEDDDEITP